MSALKLSFEKDLYVLLNVRNSIANELLANNHVSPHPFVGVLHQQTRSDIIKILQWQISNQHIQDHVLKTLILPLGVNERINLFIR